MFPVIKKQERNEFRNLFIFNEPLNKDIFVGFSSEKVGCYLSMPLYSFLPVFFVRLQKSHQVLWTSIFFQNIVMAVYQIGEHFYGRNGKWINKCVPFCFESYNSSKAATVGYLIFLPKTGTGRYGIY